MMPRRLGRMGMLCQCVALRRRHVDCSTLAAAHRAISSFASIWMWKTAWWTRARDDPCRFTRDETARQLYLR